MVADGPLVYNMYRAGEVSVHRACCEWATQPYSLGWGGTFYPGSRSTGVTIHLHCLLTGISIRNKNEKVHQTLLNLEWARPIEKDGKVHWANMG